jgi:hypothetical protein
MAEPVQEPKRGKTRSPNYPFIPLQAAIERAREFYKREAKNAASPDVAVTAWGYGSTSSGTGRQVLAALRAFGLLENAPAGVKLSDRALRILLDEREPSPERDSLLAKAALDPPVHARLWERFGASLPSDANLRHTLIFDFDFSEAAVDAFVTEYRGTLAYAKLDKPGTILDEGSGDAPVAEVAVGDLVQRESQGVVQFATPKRVTGFSTDGAWAFVDGSGTGLPRSELSVVEKATTSKPPQTPPAAPLKRGVTPMVQTTGVRQDVFTLAEGDAVLQWPAALTVESLQDLDDWLKVALRKIRRTVGAQRISVAAIHGWRELAEAPDGVLVELLLREPGQSTMVDGPTARGSFSQTSGGWTRENGSPFQDEDLAFWRPL